MNKFNQSRIITSHHTLCWALCFFIGLIVIITPCCHGDQQILFDSHNQNVYLISTGSWKYNSGQKYFDIMNANENDTLQTNPDIIRYGTLNLTAVYMNVTYHNENSKQLKINLIGYAKTGNAGNSTKTTPMAYTVPRVGSTQTTRTDTFLINNATIGFRLKIEGRGFTGRLYKIVFFTHFCPSFTTDTVVFPKTFTNPDTGINVEGACINSSVRVSRNRVYAYCKQDGDFQPEKSSSPCLCARGMSFSHGTCRECDYTKYKDFVGNGPCMKCPVGSHSGLRTPRAFCDCVSGYFRVYGHEADSRRECFHKSACLTNFTFGDENYKGRYFLNSSRYPPLTNETIQWKCKYGDGVFFGKCVMGENGKSKWLRPFNQSNCEAKTATSNHLIELSEGVVTEDNVVDVSMELKITLKENVTLIETNHDVDNAVKIIERVLNATTTNIEANDNILQAADSLSNVNKTVAIQSKSLGKMLNLMDDVAIGSFIASDNTTYDGENIALRTSVVAKEDNDLILSVIDNFNTTRIVTSPENNERTHAQIKISKQTLVERNLIEKKFFSFLYKNDLFFQKTRPTELKNRGVSTNNPLNKGASSNKSNQVNSYILSVSFYNESIKHLKNPIQMKFKLLSNPSVKLKKSNADDNSCTFWQPDLMRKIGGIWSTQGCKRIDLTNEDNKQFIHCECDHLTSFAVMFRPSSEDIVEATPLGLKMMSLIGCGTSIVALVITLITYIGFSNLHQKTAQKILINFCISLLCLLLVYVFGVGQIEDIELACKVVASFVQFFLLSTFLWMCIEGVGLYKKIVKATQNLGNDKRFFHIAVAIGWGLPLVATVCTAIFFKDRQHQKFCMLPRDVFFYTTLVPVYCILAANFILFVPIIREIQIHISTRSTKFQQTTSLFKRIMVTISCTLLLGLTWSLGIFMLIEELTDVFQWLFCIFNTFQGFFIFVFHVLRNDEAKKQWNQLLWRLKLNFQSGSGSSNGDTLKRKFIIRKNPTKEWSVNRRWAEVKLSNVSITDS